MFHQNVFSLITIKTGSHHEKTQHGENNDTNTKARAMVPMSRPEQILGTNTRTRSEQYWQSKPEQWQHARPKQHLLPPKQYMQTKLKKTFVSKTRVMSVMLRPEKYWSHQGKINDSTVALRNNNSLALIMKPCGGCSLEARAIAWMSMPNQYHQCGNHTRAIVLGVISAGQAKAPVATPGQQKQLRLKKTAAPRPEQWWSYSSQSDSGHAHASAMAA